MDAHWWEPSALPAGNGEHARHPLSTGSALLPTGARKDGHHQPRFADEETGYILEPLSITSKVKSEKTSSS